MKSGLSGLTTLLGGARSGKSDLAVRLAKSSGRPVTFVATAQALDDDMGIRIARHQEERPESWGLLESPQFGSDSLSQVPDDHSMLLDCVTLLVSNLMLAEQSEAQVLTHVEQLAVAVNGREGPSIFITNEVGMGVVPATEMGRDYRISLAGSTLSW